MSVISQVIRQSVLIYYDSVAISMHMPLLTFSAPSFEFPKMFPVYKVANWPLR